MIDFVFHMTYFCVRFCDLFFFFKGVPDRKTQIQHLVQRKTFLITILHTNLIDDVLKSLG